MVKIDIANVPATHEHYKVDDENDSDPDTFKSEKTGRGPLTGDWASSGTPVMTAYKLVTVRYTANPYRVIQKRVDNYIHWFIKWIFTVFHRHVFCRMDKWHGMSMDDIRALEVITKRRLDEERRSNFLKGKLFW